MDQNTVDRFRAGFEAKGEEGVRQDIAAKRYGEDRRAIAEEWLAAREGARAQASEAEQLAIDPEAKDAAVDAANSAARATVAAERAAIAAERNADTAERSLEDG